MKVTLKEIAKLTGVHSSTVSRILRDSGDLNIPEKTRQHVKDIAAKLDYRPNELARAFRLKKTNTIGLIIPDISNSFFSGVARSIETESYKKGYNLVVSNTNEDIKKEELYVNNHLNRGVDGLIIAPSQGDSDYIQNLIERNIPFVLIDRDFIDLETSSVTSDNQKSAYEAVEYLQKMGHKRIGFISGRPILSTICRRVEGYKNAVQDFNLEQENALIIGGGYTIQSGYDAAIQILSASNAPSALLVSGNLLTIGVIKAIREKGMSIPQDISLIAYMDSRLAPHLDPPLCTIAHPLEEMGIKVFDLLLESIENEGKVEGTKVVVDTELIKRRSVAKINNF